MNHLGGDFYKLNIISNLKANNRNVVIIYKLLYSKNNSELVVIYYN